MSKRVQKEFSNIEYFINRFPALSKTDEEVNVLQLQFLQYHAYPLTEEIKKIKKADVQWTKIGKLRDNSGETLFKELAGIMLDILTFFHSNAECERIFTHIRKAKNEQQGSMDISTLNRHLQHKLLQTASLESCLSFAPSANMLKKCKSATFEKLKTYES